ncbi:uncharacterized protein LOC134267726 [Saccostrea cucullata]|uniref:uncharacterized protein LOC134267726 n=1 Tax=Saccostrea cuccullata TaxID=36930 RepID=UPI002ED473FB
MTEFMKHILKQGTGIGLAVAKNVHTLVGDVDSIKRSIESAERAMYNFQQTIETLQTKINTLQLENQRLGNIVGNCQNVQIEVKSLSMKQKDLKTSVSKLEGWARKTERNQLNMTSTLALLENFMMNVSKEKNDNLNDDGKRIVSFTAGFDHFSQQDTRMTDMVFPKVITNVGGGYNPRDGVFTAPINGSYVFYTAIVSWDNGNIATYIVLNGKSQVRTFADSRGFQTKYQEYVYQTGTNLVCVNLQSGDRVLVRKYISVLK